MSARCKFIFTSKNMPKSVSGIGFPDASEAFTVRVVVRSAWFLVAKHWKTRQTTMNKWSRETLHKALDEPIVCSQHSTYLQSETTQGRGNEQEHFDYIII